MKRTSMIICLAVFVIMLNCTLGTAAAKVNTSKLTEYQQEQLERIDSRIADLRQQMENGYRYRFARLKTRTESKIRLLEVADKGEFSSLTAQAEIAQNVLELNNCEKYTRQVLWNAKNKNWKTGKLLATFQTRIAELKNNIYKRYETGYATLQMNKIYDLNVVLPKFEEKLKQNFKESRTEAVRGVISSIVCSRDKKSAVVGGKLVQQGDFLGEIKIAKINQDHIEFEKRDKSWTQKVGEPAGSYWSK